MERVKSAPRAEGGKRVHFLKVTIQRKRSFRSAALKRIRLEAIIAIASERTVSKSATKPAPILTSPNATELANLIFTTVVDLRISSNLSLAELFSVIDAQLS